ncbi:hypothetical protein HHK36_019228 [Tetracentron sinense]|uniref:DNA ligase n=1 Tax=Tetracentron sinense TaxID=13715 RepID=A0A834YVW0_TETSI|nr:hypothetical protein HHK36_019228 [Tetracentron sinense]
MSHPLTANDVLMANARAAARKKGRPSPSKKQKTLETNSPKQDQDLKAKEPESKLKLEEKQETLETNVPKQDQDLKHKKPDSSKKERSMSIDERIAQLSRKASEFNPKSAAYWKDGEHVPFLFLARAFDMISKESGRIAITEITCNLFRTVIDTTPDDLIAVVYLSANKIAPSHEGMELGIGDASLIKALADAYGRKEEHIKKQLKELGDLGLVAKASRSSQTCLYKPQPLTITEVFEKFRVIAKATGKDSQDKKRNYIKRLLVAATDCEPQYLIRLLQTKLRIGLAEQTLLVALGQASVYSKMHSAPPSHIQSPLEESHDWMKNFDTTIAITAFTPSILDITLSSLLYILILVSCNKMDSWLVMEFLCSSNCSIFMMHFQAGKIIKQVYSVLPIYDKIVSTLLSGGVWKISETCSFTLGVPIGPMLAKPTKGVSEIVDKFQDMEFTCEYKYDGERAQIHYMEDGSVEIYSRNAEHNTGKFPDVVLSVSRVKKSSVKSFVLDCEVVAYDRGKQKILPFQILSTRARKGVAMSDIKVDVCIFAFDILYLNGQPLLQEQLNVRREHLYESFEEEPGVFQFATALTSNDLEEIQKFLETAVNSSSEGLIIKTLNRDATYEPSKRSNNWLKLKKDYMDSIGDSLDLVPIAAFHGRGKRTGVYGAFLLACYDKENEEFQSICKIGKQFSTGFSEAMLEERSTSLRPKVISKPKSYYRYADTINPDVWFEPTEVWEVKAADLTISPVHRAAIGAVDPNKGISLRFPRLLRIREDKRPEEATSSDQVVDMYNAQKHNHTSIQDEEEDD